jgi:hypothetical protein
MQTIFRADAEESVVVAETSHGARLIAPAVGVTNHPARNGKL